MQIKFTNHASQSAINRRITEQEIIDAVRMPDITIRKHGKYYAQKNIGRGTIEVPYALTERYIRIITVYWI